LSEVVVQAVMGRTGEFGTGPGEHGHLLLTGRTPKHVLAKLDEARLEHFLSDLVRRIDMHILIPPRAAYSREPNNTGYTGFVGVTMSHIAFHHWDISDPGILHVEVFSCKPFEPDSVIEATKRFWDCRIETADLLVRYPNRSIRKII
jgi:S-adenosylmethionine/arginine decarboxylase-like enzyme